MNLNKDAVIKNLVICNIVLIGAIIYFDSLDSLVHLEEAQCRFSVSLGWVGFHKGKTLDQIKDLSLYIDSHPDFLKQN